MLTITNIQMAFSGKEVLKELSLNVPAGSIHGILGGNGAGKTTLFRTLFGLLRLQGGTIHWHGKSIHRKDCGLLETTPYFYDFLKGREYIELCGLNQPTFDVEGWNAIFQLPLHDLVNHYSTGMRKKLAFMGLLAQNRPLLLLDEPFNGVDMEGNEALLTILQRLKNSGKTILLSSHILDGLLQIADAISYLKDGQVAQTFERTAFGQLEAELRRDFRAHVHASLDKLELG